MNNRRIRDSLTRGARKSKKTSGIHPNNGKMGEKKREESEKARR